MLNSILYLNFIQYSFSYEFFLKILNEDEFSVIGKLVIKNSSILSYIQFRKFLTSQTNYICGNIGYDNLHSISFPCKLDQSDESSLFLFLQNEYFQL